MNRKLFRSMFCLAVPVAASLLVSCGASAAPSFTPQTAQPLAICWARRANTRLPSQAVFSQMAEPLLRSAFATDYDSQTGQYTACANLFVICTDGDPSATPVSYEITANAPDTLSVRIGDAVEEFTSRLYSEEFMAKASEGDLLAGLGEASTVLENSAADSANLLIVDSGITTSGFLDMGQLDIMALPCDQILAAVQDGLPDFSHCQVNAVFMDLGNTCGSQAQADLRKSSSYKSNLMALWDTILQKSGIENRQLYWASNEGVEQVQQEGESGTLPAVSPVRFAQQKEEGVYLMDSTEIGFQKDSAEFADEATALESLQKAADWANTYLAAHPASRITAVGTIAKLTPGDNAANHPLSKARADKVVSILTSTYGLPADRITALDGGTNRYSWNEAAEFTSDGTPIASAQQANRMVALICSDSAQAAELN